MTKPITLEKWEQLVRCDRLKPSAKARYRNYDIYIASGDLREDKPEEYKHGYYKTMVAFGAGGKLGGAFDLYFDKFDAKLLGFDQLSREEARLRASIREGQKFLRKVDSA